jgi:hypothetical protein
VTRKYGIVDLGTLNWDSLSNGKFYCGQNIGQKQTTGVTVICDKYASFPNVDSASDITQDKSICVYRATDGSTYRVYVYDTAYSSTSASDFKTAMSGVYLIYELATPTTESADPYQQVQIVDDFGTEEFVIDSGSFPVPVGHQTRYMANLKAKLEMAPNSPSGDGDYIVRQANGTNSYVPLVIEEALPTIPTTDGNYRLKVTVANGESTLSWEAEA